MSPFAEAGDFWAEHASPTIDDWEVPAGCPRHGRHGWPKIRHPQRPTEFRYHYRASQLDPPLEDAKALHWWELRAVAIGMADPANADLRERALSVLNPTIKPVYPDGMPDGDKRELERERNEAKTELLDVALAAAQRAGADRRATTGTVVHRLYPRYRRGDTDIIWPSAQIEAATMALHELHRGFRIDASEQFVVFDDPDIAEDDHRKVLAAGTLDARGGPAPGYILVAPDGMIFSSQTTLVIDYKTGEGKVTKAGYGVQPVPYVLGRPYDWTITDEQARDGVSGWLELGEDERPNPDWALIMHVPIERPEDAGLVWVDVAHSLHWARAAAGVRQVLKAARSQKGGVFSTFHAADVPMLDPAGPELAEPAQLQHIATVTTLDLATRIRLCHDEASLTALYRSAGTAWTWEHKELAEAQVIEIKMKEGQS